MTTHLDGRARPWREAWAAASYGPGGFYRDDGGVGPGPAAHFRTSTHVGPVLAGALAVLLEDVDRRLGRPSVVDVVDVGAGAGELLEALLDSLPDDLRDRVRATGVDVRRRPVSLDPRIGWIRGAAPEAVPTDIRGLLLAHEWLDDVPLDVVEVDDRGATRTVLVDGDGVESLGPEVDDDGAAWLARWWPVARPGDRAEVGLPRDEAWRTCVDHVAAGTALAVDYGHVSADRAAGRWSRGTLTAYRGGRVVATVPDGRRNLTAHVAVDAVAASVGATVSRQRAALLGLGVDASLPGRALADHDPSAYADSLERAGQAAELLDPSGLGAFSWLRVDRPAVLDLGSA